MPSQAFVDRSFEGAASTDAALALLRQLRAVLLREGLRVTLDAKHAAAFQRFGGDIEAVQQLYERQKRNPPLPRHAPPVAGHVQWARQLLRRIEGPMNECGSALLAILAYCALPATVAVLRAHALPA